MFPRGLVYLEIVGSHNDLYGLTTAEQIDAFVHLLEGKAMVTILSNDSVFCSSRSFAGSNVNLARKVPKICSSLRTMLAGGIRTQADSSWPKLHDAAARTSYLYAGVDHGAHGLHHNIRTPALGLRQHLLFYIFLGRIDCHRRPTGESRLLSAIGRFTAMSFVAPAALRRARNSRPIGPAPRPRPTLRARASLCGSH